MMEFLRFVRRAKWEKHPEPDQPEDSGLHCSALFDMQIKECRLSVYAVTNEIDRQRVAVAYAATRDQISVVDYFAFKDSALKSLGITVQKTKGNTPDNSVNDSHYDLENLTVRQVAQLAEIVSKGEYKRIPKRCIKTLLYNAVRCKLLDATKVRPSEIQERLSSDV